MGHLLFIWIVLQPSSQWALIQSSPAPAATTAPPLMSRMRWENTAQDDDSVLHLARGTLVHPHSWSRLEFDAPGTHVSLVIWQVQVWTGPAAGLEVWTPA